MAIVDDVKTYITGTFAPDISPTDLPDDTDLGATGILTSISTVQLLGWAGRTYRIPINSISIDPAQLRTPGDIATFISNQRTDLISEGA
jgi:acyl carrier protein